MNRIWWTMGVVLLVFDRCSALVGWSAETASNVPVLIPAQVSQMPAVTSAVKSAVAMGADQAAEVMNQNLTFNLNYSPTQIKMPPVLPPNFMQNIMEKIPVDTARQWGYRASGFMSRKKYLLLTCTCAVGYVWTCHLCVKANAYMARVDAWSMWKRTFSLDELTHLPQDDLTKDLLIEIQRRYINHNNPTDFIMPLIIFVHEIEHEMAVLKRIQQLSKWLSRLFLVRLFPLNREVVVTIDERIARLAYINNLFLSWAAQYAVEHNKPGKWRFVCRQ